MNARMFRHHTDIWTEYPQLVAIALCATLKPEAETDAREIAELIDRGKARLSEQSEGEFFEVQAWRRVFASMGYKPTQYRSASEALLRRLRIDGSLPAIIPIIDLCNAVSVAYATPIAVFDIERFSGNLEVCHADGAETFTTFSGEVENPVAGEIIFRDDVHGAHARRWAHRQSGTAAAREDSRHILIVSEAMHEGALATQTAVSEALVRLLEPMCVSISGPVVVTESGFAFDQS